MLLIGEMIGTIIGAIDGLPIGTCDIRVIGYLEGFIDEAVEDKCLCFLLFYRVCSHVRLGIFETDPFVYVCIVVEGMYTCNTGHYINKGLCLCFFLYRVFTHVILGILEMRVCVYVLVVV